MKCPATFILVWFSFLTLLCACTPTGQLYRGNSVARDYRVALFADDSQQGTWSTFDMSIGYDYRIVDGRLQVSGEGMLNQHYQLLYASVRQLRVYLFLLDASGRILQTASLPAFLMDTEDHFNFEQQLELTPDVKAFSFGYSGYAYENEDLVYFEHLPY